MGAGDGARGDDRHVWVRGVSGEAERDLRPAAGALGARAGEIAVAAGDCGGGDAASFTVWVGNSRDVVAGSGGAAAAHCEWHGARD